MRVLSACCLGHSGAADGLGCMCVIRVGRMIVVIIIIVVIVIMVIITIIIVISVFRVPQANMHPRRGPFCANVGASVEKVFASMAMGSRNRQTWLACF